jgi:hypothetical protein
MSFRKSQQAVGQIAKQHVSQMPQDVFRQQVVAHIALTEYALNDIHEPMGVLEYHLTQALPDNLKPSLRRIEDVERKLGRGDDE